MRTVSATYENGVVLPDSPLCVPEHFRVVVVIPDQSASETDGPAATVCGAPHSPWPVAPDGIGDLTPFIGTWEAGAVDPVKAQRMARDAEWP